jgi:hypothetical protein
MNAGWPVKPPEEIRPADVGAISDFRRRQFAAPNRSADLANPDWRAPMSGRPLQVPNQRCGCKKRI